MQYKSLLLTGLVALVAAQDIDSDDVPSICQDVCKPVVHLTENCDNKTHHDKDYIDCVCKADNAKTQVPLCASCLTQNSKDGDDNDANDIVSSCSFSATKWTSGAVATGGSTPASSAAASTSAMTTSVSGSASMATQSAPKTGSSESASGSASGTTTSMGQSSMTSGAAASASSPGAAAALATPAIGLGAGLVMGLLI